VPDFSAVVVIPTNAVTVYVVSALAGNAYSSLVALGAYSVLATYTYGGLQSLSPTLGEVTVLPTGAATVTIGLARTLQTYGNMPITYANYGAMAGLSYGQLQVLP
jgi:hypothetical protein